MYLKLERLNLMLEAKLWAKKIKKKSHSSIYFVELLKWDSHTTFLSLTAAELTCKFVPNSVDNLDSFFVESLRLHQTIPNLKKRKENKTQAGINKYWQSREKQQL